MRPKSLVSSQEQLEVAKVQQLTEPEQGRVPQAAPHASPGQDEYHVAGSRVTLELGSPLPRLGTYRYTAAKINYLLG